MQSLKTSEILEFEKAEISAFNSLSLSDYFQNVIPRINALGAIFEVSIIGELPFCSTYLPIYKISTPELERYQRKILITAGVHGNEPGGVYGALNFLEDGALLLDSNTGIVCYPCVNPRGYMLNSRWNGEGLHSRIDLNRSFQENSTIDEVKIIIDSLKQERQYFEVAIDLHETMPNDSVVMAIQYPDRESNPYDNLPDTFYMYETCRDLTKRVGREVIATVEKYTPVCKWDRISLDQNSGGVIFYPDGAENPDYKQETSTTACPLDTYLNGRYTDHTFTTETYGDVSVSQRGKIQQLVIKSIVEELSKR